MLVVFEGTEGVGKTTQVTRLASALKASSVPHVQMREPGGTAVGDSLRAMILTPERQIAATTEALLFMASRAQLIAERIAPALERGEVVILDRFFLSTYAYQIDGWGLPEESIRAANSLATAGIVPDITLLMRAPVELGLSRAHARGGADHIERSGEDFHARVAGAFERFATREWQDAHPECGPITVIDGADDEDVVFTRITDALASHLPTLSGAHA